MRYALPSLALFGLLCTCGPAPEPDPAPAATTAPAASPDDWEILFDGTDTGQWRAYNGKEFPDSVWSVSNGELVVDPSTVNDRSGGDVDLVTRSRYRDFELKLEYALGDSANSGILYLVREIEDTPIWHSAPEYQLLDDDVYAGATGLQPTQLTGANYGMHARAADPGPPDGEWNTARIVKRGPQVTHYLNGREIVAYTLHNEDWRDRLARSKFADLPHYAAAEEGHIGLQEHGHRVRFRNIRIRRLDE